MKAFVLSVHAVAANHQWCGSRAKVMCPIHSDSRPQFLPQLRPVTLPILKAQASDGVADSETTVSPDEQLVRAAMLSDVSSVKAALDAGAKPSYASTIGDSSMTALMWACSGGNTEVVSTLLEAGLTRDNINAVNSQGLSAIVYAFDNLPSKKPRDTLPGGFPMSGSNDKLKPAPKQVKVEAKVTGHSGCAKLLLVNGADVNAKNAYDENLLHLAARKGHIDWMDILVMKGVDPNAESRGYRHTPLALAAIENHVDCVKYLCSLKGVVNIDATNVVKWTPLLWASATGAVESVEALLEAGADPNCEGLGAASADGEKTTTNPLKEARKCSEARKVSLLLVRAGAKE
jgi:ankyrin repeat protein